MWGGVGVGVDVQEKRDSFVLGGRCGVGVTVVGGVAVTW